MRFSIGATLSLAVLCLALALGVGCARYPDDGGTDVFPDRLFDITLDFADAINESYYYYACFSFDGDIETGPLPVQEGPYWGNGWGTGSIAAYVRYHQGQYRVYSPLVLSTLIDPAGGIVDATGNPDSPIAGSHRITINTVTLGAASVSGEGMITGATNNSTQNAGTFAIETDASGNVVADSVAFTPAEHGGRTLETTEQNVLDALNAGGAALTSGSLSSLGVTLSLGPAAAGTQTVTIAPTQGAVEDRFSSYFGLNDTTTTGVLYANDKAEGPTPVIPGVTFTTGSLVAGRYVEIVTQYDVTETDLGPPYQSTPRSELGDYRLRFQLDLEQIGNPTDEFQFNVITTDQLVYNPEILLDKSYDGLGPDGTTFVTLQLDTNQTFSNGGATITELSDDVYLGELSNTDFQPGQIDIVNWELTVNLSGDSAESGESSESTESTTASGTASGAR